MFNTVAQARLRGLCGLGALDLLINKSTFLVGEAPGYSISGAAINAPILWSSTKNGLPTGETLSDYGHKTDGVGVWAQAGGNWTVDQVGQWTKTAKVGDETDSVVFQVLPAGGGQQTTGGTVYVPVSSAPKPLPSAHDTINLLGYDLPAWAVYGGAALAAYLLFFKKK